MLLRDNGAPPRAPTKRRILEASLRLFSERGYHRTTVRDIAEQVGVTDAALYRHFPSKRGLLEALLEEAGLREAYHSLATVPDSVPLERALVGMGRGALRFMEENRNILRVIMLEGLAGDDTVRDQYQEITQRWAAGVAGIIRQRASAEGLDVDSAQSLAEQLVALLWGTFLERLLGPFSVAVLDEQGALTPAAREYARTVVQRLVNGARAEHAHG